MRQKRGYPTQLQNVFQGRLKGFSGSKRYKYPKSIAKLNLSYQVKSHERSTFRKNMTQNSHFPRPAETDPYEVWTFPFEAAARYVKVHQDLFRNYKPSTIRPRLLHIGKMDPDYFLF